MSTASGHKMWRRRRKGQKSAFVEHILSANRLDGSPSREERHSYLIPREKEGEEKISGAQQEFPREGEMQPH